MSVVPDSLVDYLPTYDPDEYNCDGCAVDLVLPKSGEAVAGLESEVCYRLLNVNNDIDLCLDCYSKLPEILLKLSDEDRARYTICDICFQNIIGKEFWSLGGGFDVCTGCIDHVKDVFFPMTREVLDTKKGLICTDRGYLYQYKVVDLTVPSELQDRIGIDWDEDYLELLESLVRPPSYDWNAAEWKLMSSLDNVPSYDACCGFGVRCIPDHYQIASIVLDNHGRMAMNIVFEGIGEFLEAEQLWLSSKPSEEERLIAVNDVAESFSRTYSCEDPLIMKATNSFAVYTRLQKGLTLYYG